jgi:hypothetical protein
LVELGGGDRERADFYLADARKRIAAAGTGATVIAAATFFVALPIASRSPDPAQALSAFGIEWQGSLESTFHAWPGSDRAGEATLRKLIRAADDQVNIAGSCSVWEYLRRFDRAGFSDLGRLYFSQLLAEVLREAAAFAGLTLDAPLIERHAWESSKIVQSFSARWFQKCALTVTPDEGSIRWYVRHCLGKLDMELERELVEHPEQEAVPRRRRTTVPPSLGLGI